MPDSNVFALDLSARVAKDVTAATGSRRALKDDGGDGTLPPMDIVDAKISAVEARTDTKFAELRGDLKDFATKSTVWQAAAVIIATLLAAIAFGGDRFDAGIGMADSRQAQMQRDADQDKAVKEINGKLDQLIASQQQAPGAKKQ